MLAGEFAETLTRFVVGADRNLIGHGARRDFSGDAAELTDDGGPMLRVAKQHLHPGLRPVVRRHVVVDEQLAEQDADSDVRERAEREELSRRLDEPLDLGVFRLELLDDRADRFVYEREPDLFGRSHAASVGDDPSMEPLAALAAEPRAAALLFDVDGTLAPIVPDPDDARVPEGTRAILRRLAASYALVGCVSGRTEDVARTIVGVPELTYVGEHGLGLDSAAAEWSERIDAFARRMPWPAELKPHSAAFHYRTASDHDAARTELERIERAARNEGFRTRWGRLVLEVLPPVDASKGTAVRHLLDGRRLRRGLYAGDDTTDLDAFAVLDGLEVAVRVAVATAESPPELAQRADVVVGSPAELVSLLAKL